MPKRVHTGSGFSGSGMSSTPRARAGKAILKRAATQAGQIGGARLGPIRVGVAEVTLGVERRKTKAGPRATFSGGAGKTDVSVHVAQKGHTGPHWAAGQKRDSHGRFA